MISRCINADVLKAKTMNVLQFLKQHVKPALACTDQVTVGYGVAPAYHVIYDCYSDDSCFVG